MQGGMGTRAQRRDLSSGLTFTCPRGRNPLICRLKPPPNAVHGAPQRSPLLKRTEDGTGGAGAAYTVLGEINYGVVLSALGHRKPTSRSSTKSSMGAAVHPDVDTRTASACRILTSYLQLLLLRPGPPGFPGVPRGRTTFSPLIPSSPPHLKKQRECMELRLGVLRSELQRQRRALCRETDLRQKERAQLHKKEEAFSFQRQSLEEEKESLSKQQKECTAKREQFLKSNAQLTFRCRQLLSELSYIYPITVANQADYVICGVKLPNSEDFQAKDDGSVAVALGYTAHLVLMISSFLQIPLRYPRFHFEYGVYLLNKNIAQLRYQHGLSTPDLSQTLPNLRNFLEHGLLVRCDQHFVSGSIPVPGKSQLGVTAASEMGFPCHTSSPERGPRKRASSETDKLNSSSSSNSGSAVHTEPTAARPGLDAHATQSAGAMNGGLADPSGPSDQRCSVEQAEEIMGTEATGLGVGLRLGQTGGDGARLDEYPSIPVDCAVAVESDEQVLGELDAAGFEEFSRRIYALNENMSSFRRPRKNSDKCIRDSGGVREEGGGLRDASAVGTAVASLTPLHHHDHNHDHNHDHDRAKHQAAQPRGGREGGRVRERRVGLD
ncbi:hypothetical protein CRUP_001679 [Coryphaenoides rupestris]|nr:hypothetical protein CRUP_001679 [Coryphaenoides rupestris]